MKAIGRIVLLIGILALFSLACQTAGQLIGGPTYVPTFASDAGQGLMPTFTFLPSPTTAVPPTLTPEAAPTEAEVVEHWQMIEDDFSDVNSGWVRISVVDGQADYLNGGYLISVQNPNRLYWATSGNEFTNVRVEVDAVFSGGGEDNSFGVICRYQGEGDFYAMVVSADGYYAIRKRIGGGELQTISGDYFAYSDKIRPGQQNNSIVAECVYNQLRLFVNGEKIAEVTDSDLANGDVGMIAGTFTSVSTEVLFDNFRATEIQ